jgi:uncharacterized protein
MGFVDIAEQKYYHAALMSGPAVTEVLADPFEFARSAGIRSGHVALAALPRLQDLLYGNDGALSYTLAGGSDRRQRPQLRLEVSAVLTLSCSRCLAALRHELRLDTTLLLVQPGSPPADDGEPDAPEWIEAGRDLDLLQLLEDEILLGLPIAVRHADGACEKAVGAAAGPFASPSGLRGGNGGNKD